MQIKKCCIIGIITITGLILRAGSAHAIYSSRISKELGLIKQNVLSSREHNGSGSLISAIRTITEQDKKNKAAGRAVGLSAEAREGFAKVMKEASEYMLDPLFMPFNILPTGGFVYISNCLRDDIWELENLKDAVAREMIKAYLMDDKYNGDKLMKDYNYLDKQIEILKDHGRYSTGEQHNILYGGEKMSISKYLFEREMKITPYMDVGVPKKNDKKEESPEECKNKCMPECATEKSVCLNESCKYDNCENNCEKTYAQYPNNEEYVEECKRSCEDDRNRCTKYCEYKKQSCEAECKEECSTPFKIEWQGCPESDFAAAFNELFKTMRNLKTAFNPKKMIDWGSILAMAEASGRRKGEEWIAKNKITLTVGGRSGGTVMNLTKGGGLERMAGWWEVQKRTFLNMMSPLVPLYEATKYMGILMLHGFNTEKAGTSSFLEDMQVGGCAYYYPDEDGFRACTPEQYIAYRKCRNNPEEAKKEDIDCGSYRKTDTIKNYTQRMADYDKEAEEHEKEVARSVTAFTYHTQMNTVSENNIYDINRALEDINNQIILGYEGLGTEAGPSLPTLLTALKTFYKKHCGGGKK